MKQFDCREHEVILVGETEDEVMKKVMDHLRIHHEGSYYDLIAKPQSLQRRIIGQKRKLLRET